MIPLVTAFFILSIPSPVLHPQLKAIEIVRPDLRTYASTTAQAYGLDEKLFARVIKCESGWDPHAIGDHGTSYGLVQIHLPAHPEITKEQALDPYWAIDWAAQKWHWGFEEWWTCYRIHAP